MIWVYFLFYFFIICQDRSFLIHMQRDFIKVLRRVSLRKSKGRHQQHEAGGSKRHVQLEAKLWLRHITHCNMYVMCVHSCPLPIFSVLRKGTYVSLFGSLLHCKCLQLCYAHNRSSINIYGINKLEKSVSYSSDKTGISHCR